VTAPGVVRAPGMVAVPEVEAALGAGVVAAPGRAAPGKVEGRIPCVGYTEEEHHN